MHDISAQVSLYPLRQPNLSPAIEKAIAVFEDHNLDVEAGRMSTLIHGDDKQVFAALHEAFMSVGSNRDLVMVATISNACPSETTDNA